MSTIETNETPFSRQVALIGEDATRKLNFASVCVVGLGGVGGYVCEMLARCGVGKIHLVDCDTVSVSNLNRQIIALNSTVGKKKTKVTSLRISDINPDCTVTSEDIFITGENAYNVVRSCGCSVIADCIDNVTAKTALIKAAVENGKYIISSMGTGNKTDSSLFRIADISETNTCPLARAVRKLLKQNGITKNVDVLFSTELPCSTATRQPSSICYAPAIAGIMIAEHIIKKIISNAGNENGRSINF